MEKKLKIVFLSFYSGEVYRGVETFVQELANRLVGLGHEVTVMQNGPKLEGSKYKTVSAGMSIWNKPMIARFLGLMYFHWQVGLFTWRMFRKIDRDVDIIFPTNNFLQALFAKFWTKRKKARFVVSGQSGLGIDDKVNIWLFPDVFVALTEFQKKWAKRKGNVRVEVIPNGVNPARFKAGSGSYKHRLPGKVVLQVGALIPWKRQRLSIMAVAKLENASLLLVGKGVDKTKLKELGEKYLPGRFRIASFNHLEMPAVYAAADLFVYPTVPWESFGIVLVEAMASGLPVVATDDPIRREIVGDAGIFVDPTDTEAFAKAIQKALKTKWGNRPRKQAEKFNWDDIAKRYEKLFLELMK